jgi:hypothetical protein
MGGVACPVVDDPELAQRPVSLATSERGCDATPPVASVIWPYGNYRADLLENAYTSEAPACSASL